MRRILTLAAAAAAILAPVLALPSPASAAAGPVTALAQRVALGSDPWIPTGELRVEVANGGDTEQKAFFRLNLPQSVKLDTTKGCTAVDGQTWTCGGDVLASKGTRTYTLKVTSTILEPVFGIESEGWVEGRTADGESGGRNAFSVRWPDRLPVKLAATAAPVTGGATEVDVKVTNAGTFTMGGYSLMIKTPKGVTVVSPGCSDSGRMDGVGCEVYRAGPVRNGATDRFTVKLKVTATPVTVQFFLAPTNRYTNRDTSVDLTLKAAAGAGAGTGTDTDPTLPVTGARTQILLAAGGGLVVLGAGLLLLVRRRRVVVG